MQSCVVILLKILTTNTVVMKNLSGHHLGSQKELRMSGILHQVCIQIVTHIFPKKVSFGLSTYIGLLFHWIWVCSVNLWQDSNM
jgi:hypothetical protein